MGSCRVLETLYWEPLGKCKLPRATMQQKAEHYICWCLWKCSASTLVFIPIIVLVCQSLQMSPLCTHVGLLCYTSWIYYTENGSLWREKRSEEVDTDILTWPCTSVWLLLLLLGCTTGCHLWQMRGGGTQREWGEPWQKWGEEKEEWMWEEERRKREAEAQHWNHQQMIKI